MEEQDLKQQRDASVETSPVMIPDEKDPLVITVNIPVYVRLPESYHEYKNKDALAFFIANFGMRNVKTFKVLKWQVGAFVYRVGKNSQGEIVVSVLSLSKDLVCENCYYTKDEFTKKFGEQDFAWPEKEDFIFDDVFCSENIDVDSQLEKITELKQ